MASPDKGQRPRISLAMHQFYAMRRTLATFNPERMVWARTPDSEVDVAGNLFAAELAHLLLARDRNTMDPALCAICEDPKNFKGVVKALSSRVLVMVGTPSRAYWHFSVQQAREAQDSNVPKHSDAVCSFCHNYAWLCMAPANTFMRHLSKLVKFLSRRQECRSGARPGPCAPQRATCRKWI